ncbi:hypothetical protein KFE25_009188 [Diacronema lutheri]|uniref:CRAL-TRIO domain-containing protein n=1 Tax=Diacronema lutheri TaxID=2081491 RepID=A0A7R9UVY4_DIALT|nr:hypothetical protein KFE25_009188 [Diacronema lutheri]|mmetsp:Transcript_4380/g.13507  ORF Transcript_4380/g.13507 Transcript_4380/m.13507 type:complete len:293 (+) Transcript_4380:45-923(+)
MAPAKPPASLEWEPLDEQQVDIFAHCVAELGPELRNLPDDLVTMLVRGYVGEKDPKQCAVEHMIETSDWRKENDIETALTPKRLPENRQEFERLWRSSIIGEDADGHPIVMESIGKIPTKEFAAAFTGDAAKEANFLAHSAFNKEILRKRNIVKSNEQQKRIYKMVVVLDLAGLSMSHLGSTFTGLLKTYIGKFSNLYPESLHKLLVINAPFVFSGAWGAISLLMHPVTRAKIHIISNPKYALDELKKMGSKLDFSFEEAYAKAPPLSSLAPQLQQIPPPFNPPNERRPRTE